MIVSFYFAFSEKSDTFANLIEGYSFACLFQSWRQATEKHTSPDGGIGRRAGLKHQWSNPCRFDPGSGYRSGVSVLTEAPFSLKNGSLPIRIGIIGLNSAVRQFPFSNNYGGEYSLWIVGDMENVCTFVPSLIKVCYNLLQIRHHPNDVFSFFLDSYRGAYSEPPRIVFTSSKQFNQ